MTSVVTEGPPKYNGFKRYHNNKQNLGRHVKYMYSRALVNNLQLATVQCTDNGNKLPL